MVVGGEEAMTWAISKWGEGSFDRPWEDTWLGSSSLAHQYPLLYNISQWRQVSVASMLTLFPINVGFMRRLISDKWDSWVDLCCRLMEVRLNDEVGSFVWNSKDKRFYVVPK
jgi:hypothetical protein